MKRKAVILSACFIMILAIILLNMSAFFASGAAAKSYSLREAIDRAQSANMELNLLSQKITLAQKRRDDAGGASDLEKRKRDKAVTDLVWEKDQKEKKLKLDVTELYHKILINQKYIDLQSAQKERLEKEYEAKKLQVELGNYTAYDKQMKQTGQQVSVESSLVECGAAIAEAENKLASLKNDRQELVMKLNREMGDDIEQNLILKNESIPDEKLDAINLREVADDMVLQDYSIVKLRNDRSIAEDEKSSASGTKKEELEDSILKLGYDIEDKEADIKYKVWTDYNNIQNLRDEISLKKLDYDKYVKLSEIAKLKNELGIITFLEYTKAVEDKDNAYCAYEESRLNYYIAVRRYKDYILS